VFEQAAKRPRTAIEARESVSFLDNVIGLSPFFDILSIANAYRQTKQKTFSENA